MSDEMSDEEPRCWGLADDGSVVEVVVGRSGVEILATRWPPMGLIRSGERCGRVERVIRAMDDASTGELVVVVDGEVSPGGWDRVESELALFASERLAGLIAVHAAVIIRGARALVVPGSSGVGKSTLCAAAAAATTGARVLTDEYALVDPVSGLVTGWRRPVKLRRADGQVDRLDLTVASAPVAVGLVAFVAHDPGAGRSWAPLSSSEAVLGLLANTVCARSRPDESLDAALAIGRLVPAVAGVRGEAGEAILELLDLADRYDPRDRHDVPPELS